MTTTLPASINLAAIGNAESGTGKYIANSGSTVFNFDGAVISVALTVYGNTMAISPGFDFGTYSSAIDIDNITITAVGNGSTTLEIVSGKPSATPTVSIPVTVGAVADDESYLNKRGLAHFWENIDTLKQDKLTAGTNIAISANNTISASQPTVGNATLTIQKNGTSAGTFTANATSDKTINITVPTKTSDITNDSGFVTSSVVDGYAKTADLATVATSGSYNDLSNKPTIPAAQVQSNWTQTTTTAADYIKNKPTLATVATSGSYNDLSNKPTIPTVNNATLTIQKNGATVKTFTANASSNVTANITVPTTVAELSDASIYVTAEDIASTSALTPPVQTNMIADGAVTSDKIDWGTTAVYGRNSSVVALTTSNQTVLTIPLTIFDDTDVLEYSVTVLASGDASINGLIVGAAGGREYTQVGTWGRTCTFVDYDTKANLGGSLTIIARKDASYTLNKVLAVAVVRRIG